MTITGSLSNALSGLNAAARAAEVVSSNVANSLTEGYGRREIDLASRTVGGDSGGVRVQGVHRSVDERTIGERRLADAALGNSSTASAFFNSLEQVLGLPDDPSSLTGRLANFEASLIEAASRPDSEARQTAVLANAKGLTDYFQAASGRIQALRLEADKSIDQQVDQLNQGLSQIRDLNYAIQSQLAAGYDAAGLMDQRQQAIDTISGIVPLHQVARAGGQVALFTEGGAILLDGRAAEIVFDPVATIVPQMVYGSSTLSGLSINGLPVSITSEGPLAGGSLAAQFAIRDESAGVAQRRLDAVARDLLERFADPAVDPSLGPLDAGLFTDASSVFNPVNEIGLSSRLEINDLVDPAAGGAVWRLRDGIGALTQGDVGNSSLLLALIDTLGVPRVPASGGFNGAARSSIGLASDFISLNSVELRSAESDTSFALATVDILTATELRSGVDTDYEMQQLLLIEQAYAANARVVSTIDDMIQTILGL